MGQIHIILSACLHYIFLLVPPVPQTRFISHHTILSRREKPIFQIQFEQILTKSQNMFNGNPWIPESLKIGFTWNFSGVLNSYQILGEFMDIKWYKICALTWFLQCLLSCFFSDRSMLHYKSFGWLIMRTLPWIAYLKANFRLFGHLIPAREILTNSMFRRNKTNKQTNKKKWYQFLNKSTF